MILGEWVSIRVEKECNLFFMLWQFSNRIVCLCWGKLTSGADDFARLGSDSGFTADTTGFTADKTGFTTDATEWLM